VIAPPFLPRSSHPSCSATRKDPSPARCSAGSAFRTALRAEHLPRRGRRAAVAKPGLPVRCCEREFERVGATATPVDVASCRKHARPEARRAGKVPQDFTTAEVFPSKSRASATEPTTSPFWRVSVQRFAQKAAENQAHRGRTLELLRAYSGRNVRELQNIIERSSFRSDERRSRDERGWADADGAFGTAVQPRRRAVRARELEPSVVSQGECPVRPGAAVSWAFSADAESRFGLFAQQHGSDT